MQFIDIGANLTHDAFAEDREAVIGRALRAGVAQMVVTGTTLAHSQRALELTQAYPGQIYATAGVHPHYTQEISSNWSASLRRLVLQPEVVAVGECGLDYYRNFSPCAQQAAVFEQQLALAVEVGKPLFLHQRDAHQDFLSILDPYLHQIHAAVVHCFTGQHQELFDYLDRGLFIGITGWLCDERRGTHLRELVRLIPADRLMIETDAPYLLPRTWRPKPKNRRNEPGLLPHIASELARARGQSLEQLAADTTLVARDFFRLSSCVG